MKYLLDTNILIDFFHGHNTAVERIGNLPEDAICLSTITIAEIVYGAERSSSPEKYITELDDFIESFSVEVVPVDKEIGFLCGKLLAKRDTEGKKISGFDALIVATALAHTFLLITNDKKLQNISSLE